MHYLYIYVYRPIYTISIYVRCHNKVLMIHRKFIKVEGSVSGKPANTIIKKYECILITILVSIEMMP